MRISGYPQKETPSTTTYYSFKPLKRKTKRQFGKISRYGKFHNAEEKYRFRCFMNPWKTEPHSSQHPGFIHCTGRHSHFCGKLCLCSCAVGTGHHAAVVQTCTFTHRMCLCSGSAKRPDALLWAFGSVQCVRVQGFRWQ